MSEEKSGAWWEAYRKYLTTDEWDWVRRQTIKRDKKCVKCGAAYKPGAGFQVHHRHYRHVGEGDINELESVELNCRACHWMTHNPGKSWMQKIEDDLRDMLE